MPRSCINQPDSFCYICGEVTLKSQRRNITPLIKKSYELYFGCKLGDQDKSWAPHSCCNSCVTLLTGWLNGSRHMTFAIPMVWREPKDHSTDCYFCLTKISGITAKTRHTVKYPNIPSAIRPVPHSPQLPIPVPPKTWELDEDAVNVEGCADSLDDEERRDPDFLESTNTEPHLINQSELNDLVRDLHLSKNQAELLASRLKGWNLLQHNTKISGFRDRQCDFERFFLQYENLVYCNDVESLLESFGLTHHPDEWRLFIDSSKRSLKAVLLHVGNKYPSIPLAHAANMKETYESMKLVLDMIQYEKHLWHVCGDLKVIALLLGLQLGYTKFCCFLCEWDSRDRKNHYLKKQWPKRETLTVGEKNVVSPALVKPEKVYLPPLHIKLGLMKNFVKAMEREGSGFQFLKSKFPKISDAKIKEGIFVGPDIRKLMNDIQFEDSLNDCEVAAWKSFKNVVNNFLGNNKADNYKELITELLKNYKALGCNMSLKIHFLDSHLDFFPTNLGAVSDEHGERFHQEIFTMETRYQGKWNPRMLADYCWNLKTDLPTAHYARKSKRSRF